LGATRHLGEELKFNRRRLEGNIKIFGNLVYSFSRGPKKAKEYISHTDSEATEQGNKTFSAKSNRKNAKIFIFLPSEFGGQLKLNSLSYTRIWALFQF